MYVGRHCLILSGRGGKGRDRERDGGRQEGIEGGREGERENERQEGGGREWASKSRRVNSEGATEGRVARDSGTRDKEQDRKQERESERASKGKEAGRARQTYHMARGRHIIPSASESKRKR